MLMETSRREVGFRWSAGLSKTLSRGKTRVWVERRVMVAAKQKFRERRRKKPASDDEESEVMMSARSEA